MRLAQMSRIKISRIAMQAKNISNIKIFSRRKKPKIPNFSQATCFFVAKIIFNHAWVRKKTLSKHIFGFQHKKSVRGVSYVAPNGLPGGKGKLSNDITIWMASTALNPHYRSELWIHSRSFWDRSDFTKSNSSGDVLSIFTLYYPSKSVHHVNMFSWGAIHILPHTFHGFIF